MPGGGLRCAVKLQFRDSSIIHPAHREKTNNKHIPRFLSTRLSEKQFKTLIDEIKNAGMITMATPFDEPSVEMALRLSVEVLKIGSCSALDKPLLEEISKTGKPVICSTGGLSISDIDWLVTFFKKRSVYFGLEHCVSEYPTEIMNARLNCIKIMRNRYPETTIGFSTHEDPKNTFLIQIAYALGARIFEKHVGIPDAEKGITLNKYSATPEQVKEWIRSYFHSYAACGPENGGSSNQKELDDLRTLMRGVYADKAIKVGQIIERKDVFFAMPLEHGQLPSGLWNRNEEILTADRDYTFNEALSEKIYSPHSKRRIITDTINEVRGMLNEAKIVVGHAFSIELSHHYGVEKFHEVGCIIITCFNREYAKKIIVQLSGQWNPEHYHKKKEETFHIIFGTLKIWIEGKEFIRNAGDTIDVPRGTGHEFGTETGVIFEEISTTDYPNDSFYTDQEIAKIPRDDRKTYLKNWGRNQFD
jgi:N-acetylneuraminate synthase